MGSGEYSKYVEWLVRILSKESGGKLSVVSEGQPEFLSDGEVLVTLKLVGKATEEPGLWRNWIIWCVACRLESRDEDGRLWRFPFLASKVENGEHAGFKKNDIPDLSRMELLPSWLKPASCRARKLGGKARKGKSLTLTDVLSLEAALNSPWSGSRTIRRELGGIPASRNNWLLPIESSRQVNLELGKRFARFGATANGRIRLPHRSHIRKLCPYQTPETKKTGVQLFFSSGAAFSPATGELSSPDESSLFSLGVGLVPYPEHTDGPRLMMGGKNLKQSVPVTGSEPPLVPGHIEGKQGPVHSGLRDCFREGRFFPSLGINALMAVMPWAGYTYEDGIVVSRAFAERATVAGEIVDKKYVFHLDRVKLVKFLSRGIDGAGKESAALDKLGRKLQEWFNLWVDGDRLYRFDQELPSRSAFDAVAGGIFHGRHSYDLHTPGRLDSVVVRWVADNLRRKTAQPRFEVKYHFRVDRPLVIGDKLTGRSGNKGVVTRILDEADTPRVEIGGRGYPLDLLISPCSIIGRMNLGQILEMAHGLCLDPRIIRNLKKRVPGDRQLGRDEITRLLLPALKDLGMTAFGFPVAFRDPSTGKPRNSRAFAGVQYICRLNAHAADRLQGRGASGPESPAFGQPAKGGSRSGQRLGEMENWVILSRGQDLSKEGGKKLGSLDLLRDLRADSGRTWESARALLALSGVQLIIEDEGPGFQTKQLRGNRLSLNQALKKLTRLKNSTASASTLRTDIDFQVVSFNTWEERQSGGEETNNNKKKIVRIELLPLLEENIENIRLLAGKELSTDVPPASQPGETGESRYDRLLRIISSIIDLAPKEKRSKQSPEKKKKKGNKKRYPNPGHLAAILAPDNRGGVGIPFYSPAFQVQPDLVNIMEKVLFAMDEFLRTPGKNTLEKFVIILSRYWTTLWTVMGRKKGIICGHLLGHRVPHSGRAVIVPEPSLQPDCALLPVRMILEMLEGHPSMTELGFSLHRSNKLLQLACGTAEETRIATDHLNRALRRLPGGLWCLLLRQPTLHRHSIQAFRVEAWEELTIAIPPMITPGFNADFDGDTMAAFLPPIPWCFDLSSCSIAASPGRLGDGEPQLSANLDLALGWRVLSRERKDFWLERTGTGDEASLVDVRDGLIRKEAEGSAWVKILGELQAEICSASTGAASISPLELEKLHKHLSPDRNRALNAGPNCSGKLLQEIETEADRRVTSWLKRNNNSHLSSLVLGRARGDSSLLRQTCGFVGTARDKFTLPPVSSEREISDCWITGCFWGGLNDDEMFRYSFSSREKMAMKKLSVASAGHLTRCLAEGLYETLIAEDDCGTSNGLVVILTKDGVRINVLQNGKNLLDKDWEFPGKRDEALRRICLGRTEVGSNKPFGREELDRLLESGKTVNLVIRSPLACASPERLVCARCAGSDPGLRPFDREANYAVGTPVGLIAALAIGERGTQLSMKRFHRVAEALPGDRVEGLKNCLYSRKSVPKERQLPLRLGKLFELLRDDDKPSESFKELPQEFIHFEMALSARTGLSEWAGDKRGRWLAALAHCCRMRRDDFVECIRRRDCDNHSSLKTRVMLDLHFGGS